MDRHGLIWKDPPVAGWRVGHKRWDGGLGLREVARVGHWGEEEGVGGRAAQEAADGPQ